MQHPLIGRSILPGSAQNIHQPGCPALPKINVKPPALAVGSSQSIMSYILNPEVLLHKTVPALIHDLRADLADGLIWVPA